MDYSERREEKRERMSDWKPDLYLQFEKERTQPSVDLAARILANLVNDWAGRVFGECQYLAVDCLIFTQVATQEH